MTYGDFTLDTVRKLLGITITQQRLFDKIAPVAISSWLQEALDNGMPLAFGSEKARSEFIVTPILLTIRALNHNSFSIYSGQRLDADSDKGLTGECDFILTRTSPLPIIQSPIVTIVEAKKNDIEGGLGQCAAQMVGARHFNQREDSDIETIFGCVTTGEAWQFLKLGNDIIYIDSGRYYINQAEELLGVLQAIISYYKLNHAIA
ncbi:hypothetical protein FJZ31_02480 [Candidatus Poribacteria bacterium]|nr:hypothetical protein [Candidatus Poribacteria bacterium]